jgi:hypothetical protein
MHDSPRFPNSHSLPVPLYETSLQFIRTLASRDSGPVSQAPPLLFTTTSTASEVGGT